MRRFTEDLRWQIQSRQYFKRLSFLCPLPVLPFSARRRRARDADFTAYTRLMPA